MKMVILLVLAAGSGSMGLEVLGQETAGIGVVLGVEGERLVILRVLPDSAAANSKVIHAGDQIVSIGVEDKPAVAAEELKIAGAVRMLRGPKGTPVFLTIIPAGKEESDARSVRLMRGELKELSAWGDG